MAAPTGQPRRQRAQTGTRRARPEPRVIDSERLRRIALAHQGLDRARPFGRGRQGALNAIEHLHYVQIDTISVIERAHHHTLFTRVPDYRSAHLDALVARREVFEYWFHAASYLPMRDFRFALPRMLAIRGGDDRHWFPRRDRVLEKHIVERIAADGPLRARDFAAPPGSRRSGWWDWKPAKSALEALFMEGTLTSGRREGFEKVYELVERVLPAHVDTRVPQGDEYAAFLIDATLAAHGFAAEKEMAYGGRRGPLQLALRADLARRVAAGSLVTVRSGSDGPLVYVAPATLERRPRIARAVTLLSPFDNAIIQRARARHVFAFDYQIECYVPAHKRQFGYFCLPVLFGAVFAGRADCKAERDAGIFRVRALHLEGELDIDAFAPAFAAAVRAFATFNGCHSIAIDAVAPRRLQRHVVRAFS